MNFFRKLERKFGRFAIPNLMYYIIMMYAAGFVMSLFNPYFYVQYLALDAAAILRGQVWRIVTFLVCPPQSGVLFALLAMYLYYSIGSTLERVWGTFRFNMFFFMGVLGHIIAAFLVYGVTGFSVPMSPYYLNESLFLAFACTFPEMQFLLIFIPIRAKYLGMMYGALLVYSFLTGGIIAKIEIVVSMLNFIIFFLMTRNYRKDQPERGGPQAEVQKRDAEGADSENFPDAPQMRGLRTYREGRSEPGVPLLFEMCGKSGILHGSSVYA